jgi:hypothetical protein
MSGFFIYIKKQLKKDCLNKGNKNEDEPTMKVAWGEDE